MRRLSAFAGRAPGNRHAKGIHPRRRNRHRKGTRRSNLGCRSVFLKTSASEEAQGRADRTLAAIESPPTPPEPARRHAAAHVLAHLQAAFPNADCPIAAFQHWGRGPSSCESISLPSPPKRVALGSFALGSFVLGSFAVGSFAVDPCRSVDRDRRPLPNSQRILS